MNILFMILRLGLIIIMVGLVFFIIAQAKSVDVVDYDFKAQVYTQRITNQIYEDDIFYMSELTQTMIEQKIDGSDFDDRPVAAKIIIQTTPPQELFYDEDKFLRWFPLSSASISLADRPYVHSLVRQTHYASDVRAPITIDYIYVFKI